MVGTPVRAWKMGQAVVDVKPETYISLSFTRQIAAGKFKSYTRIYLEISAIAAPASFRTPSSPFLR